MRAVPLFQGLSDDDFAGLAAGAEAIDLDAGDVVFSEGDEGDRAYVIVTGELDIVKITDGREILLARRANEIPFGYFHWRLVYHAKK